MKFRVMLVAAMLSACGDNTETSATALVNTTTVAADSRCPAGGVLIATGLDTNRNGTLDASEVQSTQELCNGTGGSTGANGTPGTNGPPGVPGASGVLPEVTLDRAPDVLSANTAYVIASDFTLSLKLPPASSLAPGDTIEVIGSTVGWFVQANELETIITDNLAPSPFLAPAGLDGTHAWCGITMSSDGRTIAAADCSSGGIRKSTDGGKTWSALLAPDGARLDQQIAASADGNQIVAASDDGFYVLTGTTWTGPFAPGGLVTLSLASSADGTHLIAATEDTTTFRLQIYTSSTSGQSWSPISAEIFANAVTVSADGKHMVAVAGGAFVSDDFGATWNGPFGSSFDCESVASAADGQDLISAICGRSSDGGLHWRDFFVRPVDGPGSDPGTALSADGRVGAILANTHGLAISTSFGDSWSPPFGPAEVWTRVAMSADGMHFAAAGLAFPSTDAAGVYVGGFASTPATTNAIAGARYDSVTLTYIGNATFVIADSSGALGVSCHTYLGDCQSPPPPPPAGEFGFPTAFSPCGSTGQLPPGYLLAESLDVPTDVQLTAIGVIATVDQRAAHAVFALYADAGDAPGALVARTDTKDFSGGDNRFTLASPVALAAGRYWVATEVDDTALLCDDPGGLDIFAAIAVTSETFATVPDVFPATQSGTTQALNMYVVTTP